MQFTDIEIELANKLKEDGLKWEVKQGDYYILDAASAKPCLFISGYITEDSLFDKLIWLPLWHQCREILQQYNIEVAIVEAILTNRKPIVLYCYTKSKITKDREVLVYLGKTTGDTDLECMYQAIGLFVFADKK